MIDPPQPTFLKYFVIFLRFDCSTLSYSIRILTRDKQNSEKSPNCVLSSFFEGATGFLVQFVICITWRPVSTVVNKRNRFGSVSS